MRIQSSPFCRLPPDVLENITYRLALVDLVGPPSHLLALLSTCKYLHAILSFDNNPHLYARIFRTKFDYRAARRRLNEDSAYTTAHAHQLVAYCRALTNIRHGDIYAPTLLEDFYCAFTLYSENDGLNAEHLQWAGLPDFVEQYLLERLWEGRDEHNGWPLESGENAFALWLYWFSLTQQKLEDQSPETRDQLMYLIRPFAIYNFRYPPFLAPDNHVRFPLSGDPSVYHEHSAITPHGFYPQYRDPTLLRHKFSHYGFRISIAEPPIGLVAKLLYVALNEHKRFEIPSVLPLNRPAALLEGYQGPTQADYLEFASRWAVHLPETPCTGNDWDWRSTPLVQEDEVAAKDLAVRRTGGQCWSVRHDNDWERLRTCADPWDLSHPRMPVYTFGSLSGVWGGLYLVPDLGNYHVAMTSTAFTSHLERPHVTASTTPVYFKLREHHCISPAEPLPHWEILQDPFDEGVMNAYCPHGFPSSYTITERDGKMRIRNWGSAKEFVYETYVEGRENGHDELTCGMCAERRENERCMRLSEVDYVDAGMVEDVDDADGADGERHADAAYVEVARRVIQDSLPPDMDLEELIRSEQARDNDDDDSTSMAASEAGDSVSSSRASTDVSYVCSGIQDIIITGETLSGHAVAWGDFRLYGRVRAWDGLVVLVRALVWHSDDAPPHNTYIFRGYLVGGTNVVGAWRHVTDSVHSIPLEGPFVVSRVVDVEKDADASTEEGVQSQTQAQASSETGGEATAVVEAQS